MLYGLMTAHLLAKNQVLILLPSWGHISTVSVQHVVSLAAGVSLSFTETCGTKHINIRRDLAKEVRPLIFAMHSQSSEFKVPLRADRWLRTSIPCFQNLGHKAHQFLEAEA